jgi:TatD DNase family protein
MNAPQKGDYIDFHVHDGKPSEGVFILESLMAHEGKRPTANSGVAYTYGIHPWFLNEENSGKHLEDVRKMIGDPLVIAVGEAGLDKLRGPSRELQIRIFEEQIDIASEAGKPLIIHCVRAWDDLLAVHRKMKPKTPWMIHGFRGSVELGSQLILRGMYISFWFEFVLRPESAQLLKSIPSDRIFLETDGADVDIREIYRKVALDLEMDVEKLKGIVLENYYRFFNLKQ